LMLDALARSHMVSGTTYEDDQSSVFNWDWFLQREAMLMQAKHAARIHLMFPSDESGEKLEQLCDEAGLLVAEVIAEVSDDPFSSAILENRSLTLLSKCTEWLAGVLVQAGDDGVSANIMYAQAKKSGYSGSTLERAKRAINQDIDSPQVESVRDGSGWVWRVAKK